MSFERVDRSFQTDVPSRPARLEDGTASGASKKVLFVCVRNAGRSQLAQALYERIGGEARSAGTQPADEIHTAVEEALEEIGIDVSNRKPKALTQDDVEWADLVVTMGCGDRCPVLPGKHYVEWNLSDPAGLGLEEVRELRADIERRVAQLA
jgi:arsenate reductase (thioredoxin)